METGSNSSGNQPRRRRRRKPVVVEDASWENTMQQPVPAPPPQTNQPVVNQPNIHQQQTPVRQPPPQKRRPQKNQQEQQGHIPQEESLQRGRQRFVQPSAISQYPERPTSSPTPPPPAVAPIWLMIPRAVAFFLGLLTLWNLFGKQSATMLSSQFWWIDLGLWSPQIARAMMGITAVSFLLFAAITQFPRILRTISLLMTITLLLVAIKNSYEFYRQINNHQIFAVGLFPVSLYTASLLVIILAGLLKESGLQKDSGRAWLLGAFTFILCLVEFPLAQMYCAGKTDYRQKADVAVVFQSRAKGDTNPIVTLEERMQTACELYKTGLVNRLILSAGSKKEGVNDISLMQKYALKQGVPQTSLILNQQETNFIQQKDMKTIAKLIAKDQPASKTKETTKPTPSLLVVTHFYQQPRIKLYCNRLGLTAQTVPAKETHKITLLNSPVINEALRLWMAWLKPLKD